MSCLHRAAWGSFSLGLTSSAFSYSGTQRSPQPQLKWAFLPLLLTGIAHVMGVGVVQASTEISIESFVRPVGGRIHATSRSQNPCKSETCSTLLQLVLPGKAVDKEQIWPQRGSPDEPQPTSSQDWDCPGLLALESCYHILWMPDKANGFNLCPVGFFFFFSHTSLIPPYSFPFSQFGRGVCTCACVLEACAMLFLVFHSFKNKGAQALRVGYVLLHVAGTVKGMGDSQTGFILQYVRDISIQEPGKDYLLFYMLNDFSELRCWSVSFQGSNVGSQQKDQEAGTHGGWGRVVNGACL